MSEETSIMSHASGFVIGCGPGTEKRNDHRLSGHQHDVRSGDVFRMAREEGPK